MEATKASISEEIIHPTFAFPLTLIRVNVPHVNGKERNLAPYRAVIYMLRTARRMGGGNEDDRGGIFHGHTARCRLARYQILTWKQLHGFS